jgi:hypothetical protein
LLGILPDKDLQNPDWYESSTWTTTANYFENDDRDLTQMLVGGWDCIITGKRVPEKVELDFDIQGIYIEFPIPPSIIEDWRDNVKVNEGFYLQPHCKYSEHQYSHNLISSDYDAPYGNKFPQLELQFSEDETTKDLEPFTYFEMDNYGLAETSVLIDRKEIDGNYYALLAAIDTQNKGTCVRIYSNRMQSNAQVKVYNSEGDYLGNVMTEDAYYVEYGDPPAFCSQGTPTSERYEGWSVFEDNFRGAYNVVQLYLIPLID